MSSLLDRFDRPKPRRLLLAALFVAAFGSHLAFTDLEQKEIGGDEYWYSYYATFTEAWILDVCRGVLGEAATCGVAAPEHPWLAEVYVHSGLDRFLAGEITHRDMVDYEGYLEMGENGGRYGWLYAYAVQTPLDIALSLANLNGLEMGLSLWLTGGYKGYLLVQMLFLALTPCLVFTLAHRHSNLVGGLLAGGVWMVFGWIQMRGHMVAQPMATFLLIAGFLALDLGLEEESGKRRGPWILLGLALGGAASFHDIGLRPFVLVPLPMLVGAALFLRRSTRRLAIWPAAWLAGLLVVTAVLFPLRHQPPEPLGPFSPAFHAVNVLLGIQPATSAHKTSLNPGDGWWITATAPELEHQKSLRERVLDPGTFLIPVSLYREWSTSWRQYPIRGIPLPLRLHQFMVLCSLAALLLWMGGRDRPAILAWILFFEIAAFSWVSGFLTVEVRRTVPWLSVLWPLGAAVLGLLAQRAMSSREIAREIGSLAAAILFVTFLWRVPVLAMILPFAAPTVLFVLVAAGEIAVFVGAVLLAARWTSPRRFLLGRTAPALVVVLTILTIGRYSSHWRQWSQTLDSGIVARQQITLPSSLPWSVGEQPWLLFDTIPGDRFEVRLDGRVIKEMDAPLALWQTGNDRFVRIWRGLSLPVDDLRPGQVLEVEVRGESFGGETTKLHGDFSTAPAGFFRGPSIEYLGRYRSIWRQRWSPIGESRVPRVFDLEGIMYRSELEQNGKVVTKDLSTDFGRQTGRWRIYLSGFGSGEAPPVKMAPLETSSEGVRPRIHLEDDPPIKSEDSF